MSVHLKIAMKTRLGLLPILLAVFLSCPAVCPAQEYLPAKVSAALIFKILTYDRSLPERFGKEVRIGVLYDRQQSAEEAFAREFIEGMQAGAAKFKSDGLTARVEKLAYDGGISPDEVAALIREQNIGVIVTLSNDGAVLRDVAAATRAAKVNSVCLQQGCLDHGIAFGVLIKGAKPKMFVNVPRTREEGSNYSSKLLTLCEKVN